MNETVITNVALCTAFEDTPPGWTAFMAVDVPRTQELQKLHIIEFLIPTVVAGQFSMWCGWDDLVDITYSTFESDEVDVHGVEVIWTRVEAEAIGIRP